MDNSHKLQLSKEEMKQYGYQVIDTIVEQYSMSHFFLIFTIIPAAVGVIFLVLNPLMKKLMHGIR